MKELLKAVWMFRGFIIESVKRDFQLKYKNSVIGSAWTILNPLATIFVYTIVFSEVMKARLPDVAGQFSYSIYLCAGILPWGLFSEIVTRSQNMFIENANLLKKISFPRLCLPIIVVSNAFVNFLIIFGLFTVFLVLSGGFPELPYLGIFALLLLLMFFAVGLGVTLGVLNVFFRDVGQFFGIFITFWFWLTPIVYPLNTLNPTLRGVLDWNPMGPLITAFQSILVHGEWPNWSSLSVFLFLAVLLNVIGLSLFRRHAGDIVDEL